jgi:hypothetical protein
MDNVVNLHKNELVETLKKLHDKALRGEIKSISYVIEMSDRKLMKGFNVESPLSCYLMMGLLTSLQNDLDELAYRNMERLV